MKIIYYHIMKKYILLPLLFLFSIISSGADIIDDLIQSSPFNKWNLPFTFRIDDVNGKKEFVAFGGSRTSIMAYRFDNNTLQFIIKDRHFSREEGYSGELLFEFKYFLIEIKKENGEIKMNYNDIKTLNLNNFIIIEGYINYEYDNINIRLSPSITGQKYSSQLFNGEHVKVISCQNYSRVNNMFDYWYCIEIDNKNLWIYGFYCDFFYRVSIEDVRNNRR
jgi:hypothetical protein